MGLDPGYRNGRGAGLSRFLPTRPSLLVTAGLRRWLRLCVGIGILLGFFWFLTTAPVPPGAAGQVIRRNLRQDVQADALFYADLEEMPAIEDRLLRRRRVSTMR